MFSTNKTQAKKGRLSGLKNGLQNLLKRSAGIFSRWRQSYAARKAESLNLAKINAWNRMSASEAAKALAEAEKAKTQAQAEVLVFDAESRKTAAETARVSAQADAEAKVILSEAQASEQIAEASVKQANAQALLVAAQAKAKTDEIRAEAEAKAKKIEAANQTRLQKAQIKRENAAAKTKAKAEKAGVKARMRAERQAARMKADEAKSLAKKHRADLKAVEKTRNRAAKETAKKAKSLAKEEKRKRKTAGAIDRRTLVFPTLALLACLVTLFAGLSRDNVWLATLFIWLTILAARYQSFAVRRLGKARANARIKEMAARVLSEAEAKAFLTTTAVTTDVTDEERQKAEDNLKMARVSEKEANNLTVPRISIYKLFLPRLSALYLGTWLILLIAFYFKGGKP